MEEDSSKSSNAEDTKLYFFFAVNCFMFFYSLKYLKDISAIIPLIVR